MRTMLIAALLFTSAANAQVQQLGKSVLCGEAQQVLEAFQGPKYKEVLRWSGKDIQGENTYVLLTNAKTGSFTIIEILNRGKEQLACILGTGTNSSSHYLPDEAT